MFNEDDSPRLLITVMSPHIDTFNTARHSRSATQCQEDYQHPLTWAIIHIFTHTGTKIHTQVVTFQETRTCLVGNGLSPHNNKHHPRQDKACVVHQRQKKTEDKEPKFLSDF